METINRYDFLKNLFLEILIDGISLNNVEKIDNQFNDYLKESDEYFNDFNFNYLLLNSILLIKNSSTITPSLMLAINELELKILRCTCQILNIDNTKNCDTSLCENKNKCDKDSNIERLIENLKSRFFIPSGDSEFKLPEEGKTGNLKIQELDPLTGKRYKAEVIIDDKGAVVSILVKPRYLEEKIKTYEEIYGGLLNDILKYSEESKYGE